jgi:flagellar basal body-associated protein FliL
MQSRTKMRCRICLNTIILLMLLFCLHSNQYLVSGQDDEVESSVRFYEEEIKVIRNTNDIAGADATISTKRTIEFESSNEISEAELERKFEERRDKMLRSYQDVSAIIADSRKKSEERLKEAKDRINKMLERNSQLQFNNRGEIDAFLNAKRVMSESIVTPTPDQEVRQSDTTNDNDIHVDAMSNSYQVHINDIYKVDEPSLTDTGNIVDSMFQEMETMSVDKGVNVDGDFTAIKDDDGNSFHNNQVYDDDISATHIDESLYTNIFDATENMGEEAKEMPVYEDALPIKDDSDYFHSHQVYDNDGGVIPIDKSINADTGQSIDYNSGEAENVVVDGNDYVYQQEGDEAHDSEKGSNHVAEDQSFADIRDIVESKFEDAEKSSMVERFDVNIDNDAPPIPAQDDGISDPQKDSAIELGIARNEERNIEGKGEQQSIVMEIPLQLDPDIVSDNEETDSVTDVMQQDIPDSFPDNVQSSKDETASKRGFFSGLKSKLLNKFRKQVDEDSQLVNPANTIDDANLDQYSEL